MELNTTGEIRRALLAHHRTDKQAADMPFLRETNLMDLALRACELADQCHAHLHGTPDGAVKIIQLRK